MRLLVLSFVGVSSFFSQVRGACRDGGYSVSPNISSSALHCQVAIPFSGSSSSDAASQPTLYYTFPGPNTSASFALYVPTKSSSAWVALAWTPASNAGQMYPADAVIGWIGSSDASKPNFVGPFFINSSDYTGIVPSSNLTLSNSSIAYNGTGILMYFERPLSSGAFPLAANQPLQMNWAGNFQQSGPLDSFAKYHGENRGSFSLQPQAFTAPSPSSADSASGPSSDPGFGMAAGGARALPPDPPSGPPDSSSDPSQADAPASTPPTGGAANDPCDPSHPISISGIDFTCKTPPVRAVGPSVTPGFGRLLYSVSDATSATDTSSGPTASFALTLPTQGWIGVSFTSAASKGQMVPATGVIGRILPGGEVDCAPYVLSNYALSGVQRSTTLPLVNCGVIQANGTTTLYFTRPLMGKGWVPLTANGPAYINWAYGSSAALGYHGPNRGSLTLASLQGGQASSGGGGDAQGQVNAAKVHGILMSVAFALLLPLGLLLGRYIHTFGRWMLYLHILLNVSGTALALAGMIYALKEIDTPYQQVQYRHGSLGIAVVSIAIAQVLLGFIRPSPRPIGPLRRVWEAVHTVIGYSVWALAVYLLATGLHIINSTYNLPVSTWVALVASSLAFLAVLRALCGRLALQADRIRRAGLEDEVEDLRAKAWRPGGRSPAGQELHKRISSPSGETPNHVVNITAGPAGMANGGQ